MGAVGYAEVNPQDLIVKTLLLTTTILAVTVRLLVVNVLEGFYVFVAI